MSLLGFKEWLSKTAPDGAGGNWSNRSDPDLDYGNYLRSRDSQKTHNMSGPAEIDPEKMYLGISKKQLNKVNKDNTKLGDENGIFNSSPSQ